jgi:regulator of cell morphogenesis and NO signaling
MIASADHLPDPLGRAHTLSTEALVDWIVEQFHEAHRRDLAVLVALAREVDAWQPAADVEAPMQALADELEQHMFKEEARLFPMMVQGGSTLIGQLIDAMQREHRLHASYIEPVQRQLALRADDAAAARSCETFRRAFEAFIAALAQHARIEDEVLFTRFARPPVG